MTVAAVHLLANLLATASPCYRYHSVVYMLLVLLCCAHAIGAMLVEQSCYVRAWYHPVVHMHLAPFHLAHATDAMLFCTCCWCHTSMHRLLEPPYYAHAVGTILLFTCCWCCSFMQMLSVQSYYSHACSLKRHWMTLDDLPP